MAGKILVERILADAPALAGREVAVALSGSAPRARAATIVVVSAGVEAGFTPAPWSLDGVIQALAVEGIGCSATRIGPARALDGIARVLASRGIAEAAEGQPCLRLRIGGGRRPLSIPRAWCGTRLVLLLPCVEQQAGGTTSGPVRAGLSALASRCGPVPVARASAIGLQLLSAVFCHVTVIVDATWWAPRRDDEAAPPYLLPAERCVGAELASALAEAPVAPAAIDGWIARAVGRTGSAHAKTPVNVSGSGAAGAWPSANARAGQERLADRAIRALWTRPGHDRRALPPMRPGVLSRAWDEYRVGDPS